MQWKDVLPLSVRKCLIFLENGFSTSCLNLIKHKNKLDFSFKGNSHVNLKKSSINRTYSLQLLTKAIKEIHTSKCINLKGYLDLLLDTGNGSLRLLATLDMTNRHD